MTSSVSPKQGSELLRGSPIAPWHQLNPLRLCFVNAKWPRSQGSGDNGQRYLQPLEDSGIEIDVICISRLMGY